MELPRQYIVKSTLLSQKPADNSALLAIAAVLSMSLISVLCWREGAGLYGALAAVPERVLIDGEYWRLFSAMGVHADLKHLISNAVLFTFFSYLLYGYFGLLIFPILTLLLGGLVNYLSLLTYPQGIRLVGASGLVYLMAGFWLVMYVLIERRLTLKKRIMRSVGVGLVVLMPTALQPSVSYRTHAIGFAVGVAAGLVYFLAKMKAIRAAEVVVADEIDEMVVM
jgi:rhomboid protease GluP